MEGKLKLNILLLTGLLILSGCSQPAEPTNADNGLIEAQSIERVTTAADVKVVDSYTFAVSDQVISGYDTYKQGSQIVITSDNNVEITVYGSDQPITSTDGIEPIAEHSFNQQEDELVLTEQFTYYKIIADQECDVVISSS